MMEKELLDVTKKSGIVLFGGIFANIFSITINLLAVRFIGAKEYGQYVYIFTFVSFLPVIGSLSYYNGLVYSIPKFVSTGKLKERNAIIGFCFLTGLCLSTLISLFVFLQNHWIAEKILNKPELSNLLRTLAPLSVLMTVILISNGVFVGTGKIKTNVLIQNVILPFIKLFVLLILTFCGFKLLGLVAATYISTSGALLLLLWNIRNLKLFGGVSRRLFLEYKNLLTFSLPLLFAAILVNINTRVNTYMIGYHLDVKQVAIYNIASKLAFSSIFIYSVLNSMFAPIISKLYHTGEIKKLGDLYKVITKWMVAGNLIVFSLVLLFSKDIMHIFGSEFISGSMALIIITLGQIVNAGTGSAAAINTMTGHSSYEMYSNLVLLIANIGLSSFLIPTYGINGAAITFLCTVSISNLIRLIMVYRDHHIHPYSWEYLKVIGACALSGLIIWTIKMLLSPNWFLGLVIFSFLYFILFVLFSLLFGLSESDRLVLDRVLSKFQRVKTKKKLLGEVQS